MNGNFRSSRQFGKNPWLWPKHFLMIDVHFEAGISIAKYPRMCAVCVQCNLSIWFNCCVSYQLACVIYPIHVDWALGGIFEQQKSTFDGFPWTKCWIVPFWFFRLRWAGNIPWNKYMCAGWCVNFLTWALSFHQFNHKLQFMPELYSKFDFWRRKN